MHKINNKKAQANTRQERIDQLKNNNFDLLVIGGGVTGAGIALDAASRGFKTALVEKNDFSSGTSSKSTKLIHGGLRYLKQLDIKLVRETGTERAIIHRLAPHLVVPEKMIMPLIEGGSYGYWSTSFGLKVYDILANVKGNDRRKMLNKQEALAQEPLLDEKNLKGAGYYAEYRTDDSRLTIELIKTAERHGVTVLNYCEVVDFIYENEKVIGVNCQDALSDELYSIKSKTTVSATGPWVDILRQKDGSMGNKKLHLTKGVHIVVPNNLFPLKQTVYFDVPDGRMVFAIPRGRTTYIGTTDTNYNSDLDNVVCSKEDMMYLLNAVNTVFPSINLSPKDVESSWAGLRPLIHQDGKSPSELSRKDEIFESPTNLISIAGGKLTGYRKMSQRIVDIVAGRLKSTIKEIGPCITKTISLTTETFENQAEVQTYMDKLKSKFSELNLDADYARYLVTTYGKQAETIVQMMKSDDHKEPEIALTCAEALYGLFNEHIMTASDFYVRRTGRLFFNIKSINTTRSAVLNLLANELSWDDARLQRENRELDDWLDKASTYKSQLAT